MFKPNSFFYRNSSKIKTRTSLRDQRQAFQVHSLQIILWGIFRVRAQHHYWAAKESCPYSYSSNLIIICDSSRWIDSTWLVFMSWVKSFFKELGLENRWNWSTMEADFCCVSWTSYQHHPYEALLISRLFVLFSFLHLNPPPPSNSNEPPIRAHYIFQFSTKNKK